MRKKKKKGAQALSRAAVRIRPTVAFGKTFQRLDDHHLEELFSLERERAIYSDHWIDDLKDFRKVRIAFTEGEVAEYVRGLWAYELFLRAGGPTKASSVRGIPTDIAGRADSYALHLKDGRIIGPPWHCPAAFYGRELERLVCSNSRAEILQDTGRKGFILAIKRVIDSLAPAIRRFGDRETGLTRWPVSCEDDVRDLVYVMLRGSVSDIRTEEPVPSRGGTHKFADIVSEIAEVFIEIKWIDKRGRWKSVQRQVNDDVQSYFKHPSCKTLIFLIIDAAKDIPDPAQFEKALSGKQSFDGKEVEILAFVREP